MSTPMRYGTIELSYAEPFANSLVQDDLFRTWVIERTEFAQLAATARLLHEEMRLLRSKATQTWWRSHFSAACRCAGDRGQETDILAVFEAHGGMRFALHFEVKHPGDAFPSHKDQAAAYALRAKCWSVTPPKAVVPHARAATVLLCSAGRLEAYQPHADKFGAVITFEEVRGLFPQATRTS